MPVLYDEQGNPWRGAVDYVNGDAFTEGRTTSTGLAVLNSEVVVPCNGTATVALQITGTFVGTLVLEGYTQTGQYVALPVRSGATNQYVVNGITAPGQFLAPTNGLAAVRVRMSAYTSGTANVSVRTSLADALIQVEELPSVLGLTVTAVISTAATLTIPAPGAGLFQIVDYIEVVHFAGAVGTAAATPVLVTTTNIPGNPILSCRADAFLQGTREVHRIGGSVPFKATTANTAITVVMPLTTGVIWRANAVYRIGV
jgi:hypothetical protein